MTAPTTMTAAVAHRCGTQVLQRRLVPTPMPGSGGVRIPILASRQRSLIEAWYRGRSHPPNSSHHSPRSGALNWTL